MANGASKLNGLITQEINHIERSLRQIDNPLIAGISFIRQIDVFHLSGLMKDDTREPEKQLLQERYRYGWFTPIYQLLKESSSKDLYAPHLATAENQFFADSVIQVSGKLEICKRFITFEKELVDKGWSVITIWSCTLKNKAITEKTLKNLLTKLKTKI